MLVEIYKSQDTVWSGQSCPQPSPPCSQNKVCIPELYLLCTLENCWCETRFNTSAVTCCYSTELKVREAVSVEDSDTYTSPTRRAHCEGRKRTMTMWRICLNQAADGHLLWSPWSWHGEEWLHTTTASERKRNQKSSKSGEQKEPREAKEQKWGCQDKWKSL